MNRAYELMVIIDTDVADAENKVVIDRVEELIGEAGGGPARCLGHDPM